MAISDFDANDLVDVWRPAEDECRAAVFSRTADQTVSSEYFGRSPA